MNIASRLIVADSIGNPNGSPVNRQGRHSAARYSISPGGSIRTSQSQGMSMSSFQINGLSVNKYDERNYSISKPGLPNGISRLFVSNGDMVTYVYADGRVHMKPIACLDASESQLFAQLQLEVQQSQQQFQMNMHQMQQNMHKNMMNMQQNMQQSMQNMRNNMANMFSGVRFPFGASQAHTYAGPYYPPASGFNQQGSFASAGPGAFAATNTMAPMSPSPAMPSMPVMPAMPAMPAMPSMPNMMNMMGNNFPFGPNNNPFGNGFPFGR